MEWISFCEKFDIPHSGVEDLSVLLNDTSFIKQYDAAVEKIIHHSSFGRMAIPFVVCGSCRMAFQTEFIFCPNCKQPLIKYCKECGLTEAKLKQLGKSQNTEYLHLKCNHIERVDSKDTVAFYMISPESLIATLFSISFHKRLICTRPSQVLSLVEYVRATSIVTPFTDINSARLWDDIGFPSVAAAIRSVNMVPDVETNVLEDYSMLNMKEWGEIGIFHIKGR